MANAFLLTEHPHLRKNILTGEWVMVSPHRSKRPWQGKVESVKEDKRPVYDPACYLCSGNARADGARNETYAGVYSFVNDFSALLENTPSGRQNEQQLLIAKSVQGICKVICFSPNHSLTLPLMQVDDIKNVVDLWQKEFYDISQKKEITYIQIFENKGEIMGCSNSHPHGQIWASSEIPMEIRKETAQFKAYFRKHRRSLLTDYLSIELKKKERILIENPHFVALVPYWAVWPFETMIVSKRHIQTILQFSEAEKMALATILKQLTTKYDNLFNISFPYSAGIHQAPMNSGNVEAWHWHMHFYPPLLRSATVKKFMVGYELLANPQRDITPETAAERLNQLPFIHYSSSEFP